MDVKAWTLPHRILSVVSRRPRCRLLLAAACLGTVLWPASPAAPADQAGPQKKPAASKDRGEAKSGADAKLPQKSTAGKTSQGEPSLLDLDVEQLGKVDVVVPEFNVEVTSVTKSESTVGKSPAAIYVITPEMIRRSGAKSLPEVLRMVPGMNVARISSNTWAVGVRGFSDQFANKLLVLIDGRSVYTPFFGGVHWDQQDVVLEDVARIEVIRGPGSTLWGANAVNGVINVITKKAEETQGLLVSSGGGSEDKSMNTVRFGGQLAKNLWFRFYGKQFDRDTGFAPLVGAHDDWRQGRVGFRLDWLPDECDRDRDRVTLQGDFFEGVSGNADLGGGAGLSSGVFAPSDTFLRGQNVLARWTRTFNKKSNVSLQTYYDRWTRNGSDLEQTIETFDVEFTHRLPLGDRHDVTWGLQYRLVRDDLGFPEPLTFTLSPDSRRMNFSSAFIQDRITLLTDKLFLTAGSKFSSNTFTGFEYQPTGRLLWAIDNKHAAWTSVTRAVRIPTRFEDDIDLTIARFNVGMLPARVAVFGNRGVDSEKLMAYEAGFRAHPTKRLSWDVAVFFNQYEDLVAFPMRSPFFGAGGLVIPRVASNDVDGESYGVEVSSTYEITPDWRVRGWYSFLQVQLHKNFADDGRAAAAEGTSPHNQVYLMSSWNLTPKLQFDLIGRYVDNLPAVRTARYIAMDLRLGWRPNEHWEFSVIGRNLLDRHHREFRDLDNTIRSTEVERGVYAEAVLRY